MKNGLFFNYQNLRCEYFKEVPKLTQCFKCQQLGHIAKNCKNSNTICAKCGKIDHTLDENGRPICEELTKFCILCKQDHSSAYAKCPTKIERINQIKSRLNNRSYASALSKPNYNDVINNDLTEMINTLNNKITDQLAKTDSILSKIANIDLQFTEINKIVDNLQTKTNDNSNEIMENNTTLENNINNNQQFLNKIIVSFIDFFYIVNPKKTYDAAVIDNIKIFLQGLGHNINSSEINKRLNKISIPNQQNKCRSTQ